ncbi:COG1361 S-layer family protein [Archaeoglobus veneficus]|uniref:S-layer domain-like protein n=1 Tax=Archaeoglobus veneficus (strain DSM 11195 / SNP6) TaxID=693661 RepID=F2KMQ4_ARCVS|nr:CARDB domain-containing protein [Archaeoglobus veneficus]AEA46078.1 S-layer domain-like protein [Archaeoglobus veneficus SNP6]
MKRVRYTVIAVVALILLAGKSFALDYKDEPYFTAYIAGSDHVGKGESQLTVVVTNNAILREVTYNDYTEYAFISSNTNMLTTAYNVSLSFEGCDGIEVRTPGQYFAAFPAMKPVQLPISIKVKEGIKAGEYTLKLKISYEVIDYVFLDSNYYQPTPSSVTSQIQKEYNDTGTLTKTTVINETVLPKQWFDWIKYKFKKKEQTIELRVVVEEEDVKLEVVGVKAENFVAGGKGKLTVTIRNAGEKTAKDLFVMLTTPSGFTSFSTLTKPPTEVPAQTLQGLLSMLSPMAMGQIQIPQFKIPEEITAVLAKGTYFVGDLPPNSTANVTFVVDISTDEAGYYPFQLKGVYVDEYGEVKQTPNTAFGVWLEEGPEVEVLSTNSSIYAGSKGELEVTLKISMPVEDAKLSISANPPLSAIVSEYYLGDVSGECKALFKLKASRDAEAAVYPAKLKLTYKIGDKEASKEVDIGVAVHERMKFGVEGMGVVPAGEEAIVTVKVKNLGSFEVKDATARITVVDPFSTTDDTAYIGSLKPGEETNVSFKLKADKDATPKLYALNLEVKYKDPSDEWVISEPVKMPVKVVESKGIPKAAIGVIVVAAIAVASYVYRKRKSVEKA